MEKLRADAEKSFVEDKPQSTGSITHRRKNSDPKQFLRKMSRQSQGEFNSATAKSVDKPSRSSAKKSNKSAIDTTMPIINKTEEKHEMVPGDQNYGISEQDNELEHVIAKRKTILLQDFKLRKDSNDPDRGNNTNPLLDQIV